MNVLQGKKVVVTGGAGFVGSHLVEVLVHQGASVVVVDNLSTGTLDNLAPVMASINFLEGDINSRDILDTAMRGATYVVHMAAFVSVPGSMALPLESHTTNVTGTLAVLDAARRAKVSRFIYISSSAVYGSTADLPAHEDAPHAPESPYAAQKSMGETYTHLMGGLWGMETVRLRPFNIYGPRQNPEGGYAAVIPKFASSMARGTRPVIYGDGKVTRDFIYVSDAVDAIALSLVAPDISGGVFNIASGTEVSIADLVRTINGIVGTTLEPQYEPAREGDILRSVADIRRAKEGLGFLASTPLKTGLTKTIESFSQRV